MMRQHEFLPRLRAGLRLASTLRLAIGLLLACAATLPAQVPTLTSVLPSAVQPGVATDVSFVGDNLQGVKQLWTNFPAKIELAPDVKDNGQRKDRVVYRIETAPDLPVGIYAARVNTDKGVSNLRVVLVDDLAAVRDNNDNHILSKAQLLTLPTAVDGTVEATTWDYYKIAGKAGQRVTVEVLAQRLGSTLDSVLRLLDATGQRELAYSDDVPGLGIDSRLSFVLPQDGDYLIELRDVRYQGGANYRYHLRVGDFPLANVAYPASAPPGSETQITFLGSEVANVAPVKFHVPPMPPGGQLWLNVKSAAGQASGFVPFLVRDLADAQEVEPNDGLDQANAVAFPVAVQGRLEKAKDRDFFQVALKKGERVSFRGQTRSFGSPTDLFLRLYDAAGKKVAESDVQAAHEGLINYTPTEDGNFRLMVEDLHRRGGPLHAYRIEVQPSSPGFSLTVQDAVTKDLAIEHFNAPQKGWFQAKVVAARQDYDGPIELKLADAGEGWKLLSNTIPEKKNEIVMQVQIPPGFEPGQMHRIRILGTAKIGKSDVTIAATPKAALQKLFNYAYPPESFSQDFVLGVGPVFPEYFKISVKEPEIVLPRVIGATKFTVKAERLLKFDDQIRLGVSGLPDNVKFEAEPIAKGKAEAQIKLTGAKDLPVGEHKFRIVGKAIFQAQHQDFELGSVVLHIREPLQVSLAPLGSLQPGKTLKVKVQITRFGEGPQPVKLSFKNLPAGVTAPADLTIPADKQEREVELTATAEATLGRADDVRVTAQTRLQNQDVTVESSAAVLEVKTDPSP